MPGTTRTIYDEPSRPARTLSLLAQLLREQMAMAKVRKKAEPIARQDSGDITGADSSRERIAFRAYELYLARGGQHGRALDDWLEAEQELLQLTRGSRDRE